MASREPTVQIGASANDLAIVLGVPGKGAELAEQIERLVSTRVTITVADRAEVTLLDARGRPKTLRAGWLPTLRLTSRFLASLEENAVELDPLPAQDLTSAPAVFDAYVALRAEIAPLVVRGQTSARWDGLMQAAGIGSGGLSSFRQTLEGNLAVLREAGVTFPIRVDDAGIHLIAADAPVVEDADLPGVAETPAEDPSPAPAPEVAPPDAEKVAEPLLAAVYVSSQVEQQKDYEGRPDGLLQDGEPSTASAAVSAEMPEAAIAETISLTGELTGLPWVVWLRRGYGPDGPLVGLTPTERFNPNQMALLLVEPVIMPLTGPLGAQGLDSVANWITANRDLIDDVWLGNVASFNEVRRRTKKVASGPSQCWR